MCGYAPIVYLALFFYNCMNTSCIFINFGNDMGCLSPIWPSGSWMISSPMGSEKAANKAPHLRRSEHEHPAPGKRDRLTMIGPCWAISFQTFANISNLNYVRSIWEPRTQKSDGQIGIMRTRARSRPRHTPEAIHKAINSWEPAPGRSLESAWKSLAPLLESDVLKVPFYNNHLIYVTSKSTCS